MQILDDNSNLKKDHLSAREHVVRFNTDKSDTNKLETDNSKPIMSESIAEQHNSEAEAAEAASYSNECGCGQQYCHHVFNDLCSSEDDSQDFKPIGIYHQEMIPLKRCTIAQAITTG